jgi:hypothetical protein
MNRKQLLTLVVVLAVLGGAGVMLLKRESTSWQGGGDSAAEKLLADLPVGEQLSGLTLKQGTNTLTLARREGVWGVMERGGYPADYPEISRTVLKLRDLKAAQVEEVAESQLARLELLEPGVPGSGALIEFRDKAGNVLAALLLGKTQTRKESRPAQFGGGEEMDVPVGRWVRLPGTKTRVALVSDPLSNLDAQPQGWLDKDFFKIQKIRSIEVDYPDEVTNSFKLTRESESGDWTMAGLNEGEELDSSKTSGLNYALNSPSFDDVIVDVDDAVLGLDKPTRIVIETFDGFHYEIQRGAKQEEQYPLRVTVRGDYPRERAAVEGEDEAGKLAKDKEFTETLKTRDEKLAREKSLEKWTYLVPSWTLNSVVKKRADWVKPKEDKPVEEPEPAASEPLGGNSPQAD